jgi:replicative DNA helicase
MNKVPPHNIEAEMSVLGASMIGGSKTFNVISGLLDELDFYRHANSQVYTAICELEKTKTAIDLVTVSSWLTDNNLIDEVGGIGYLMQVIDFVPTTSNIEYYANIVKQHSDRRLVITEAMSVIDQAYDPTCDSAEVVNEFMSNCMKVASGHQKKPYSHIDEEVEQVINEINDRKDNQKISGISSGWRSLDDVVGGWRKGELVVLGARPSMGKSALALAFIRNAVKQKQVSLFISIEMSAAMTTHRLLSMETSIDLRRMSNSVLNAQEKHMVRVARASLYDEPLYISSTNPTSLNDIKAKCLKLKQKEGLDLVIIDYLQMIETKGFNRVQEVGQLSRGLKQIAREMMIPVIVLSSLSRASEKRDDKRPVMSDLRESGDIESDADVALMLYRPSYYNSVQPEPDQPDDIEIIVRKNRNGPIGSVTLQYIPCTGQFHELEYGGL